MDADGGSGALRGPGASLREEVPALHPGVHRDQLRTACAVLVPDRAPGDGVGRRGGATLRSFQCVKLVR